MNGPIDIECVKLCNSINMIKGIRTKFCCVGHKHDKGKYTDFHVLAEGDFNLNMNQLLPLIWQVWPNEKQYGHRWRVTVSCRAAWKDDRVGNIIGINIGRSYRKDDEIERARVCREAEVIAMSIRNVLSDK